MKHLIKVALIALATVAAYFVYGFTSQVAPWPVAVAAAGSLVGTYIGLAFAAIPERQRGRAGLVAKGAMLIEAAYGSLYVLALQYPAFFAAPPWFVAVPIAVLHGAAFSVLAYFVSLFVVHEAAQEPAQPAQPDAAQLITLLVERLSAAPQLPVPQESYARPEAQRTQPVVVASDAPGAAGCPECGRLPSRMQRQTAAQHGGWRCQGCGTKVQQ
jgi:hypothetical protein